MNIFSHIPIPIDCDMREYHKAEDEDPMMRCICFALTCSRAWDVFRRLWCDPGTHRIQSFYSVSSEKLASMLSVWMAPKYRQRNFHFQDPSYLPFRHSSLPMFLSIEVYGDGSSKKSIETEAHLLRIYEDRYMLQLDLNEEFQNLRGSLNTFELESTHNMGKTWYIAAARQFRDFIADWYTNRMDENRKGELSVMECCWDLMMTTPIYEYVTKLELPEAHRGSSLDDADLVTTRKLIADLKVLDQFFQKLLNCSRQAELWKHVAEGIQWS